MLKLYRSVDVLNLEWTSLPSRDRQMATLICNYLRFMGYNVIERSVFNGFFLLNKLNPSILFITNSVGADINFNLIKYAKELGAKGVTLLSEGNLNEEKGFVDEMIWGRNTDRILYEDVHMQWSVKSRDITYKYCPALNGKIKVSGAVGFDVYKIASKLDRNIFTKKYGKNSFNKIIGVGCWDFGSFYPDDHRYSITASGFSRDEFNRFISDQQKFNLILKEIIINNPSVLFLLKEHPGCLGGHKASGIEGLSQFENVLILKNEESIGDCIAVSDFWIVYESTTALEAWLLNKQTCLLNPSGTDFPRDSVHYGSPNYHSVNALQNAIVEFFSNGHLPGFKDLETNRSEIIKNTIQWDDGLNHVRAGNEIIDILENSKSIIHKRKKLFYSISTYKQMIYWYLSPYLSFLKKFKNYREHVNAFSINELYELNDKRLNEQLEFYQKNNLQTDDLRKIKCI